MINKNVSTIALGCFSIGIISISNAATIITGNGGNGSNVAVPDTYGDNITTASSGFIVSAGVDGTVGTPDIELTYTLVGGSGGHNRWDFHFWAGAGAINSGGNGVLQIDGSAVNARHSITFSTTATSSVVFNSFNFVGDTNGDSYIYRIDIFDVTANAVVATQTTTSWTTDTSESPGSNGTYAGAPTIDLAGYTGVAGQTYRLDIVRTGGTGANANIGIDNISFDQVTVPEPSSTALLGLGGLALLLRHRK